MINFSDVLKKIKENRHRKYNCIPLGFDRFEPYFPGIEKATYYIITASSGVGKSRFVRSKFLFEPYRFLKDNPDTGLKMKAFYFSLEESREAFIINLICSFMKQKHDINISPKQIYSISVKDRVVDDYIELLIEEFQDDIEDFFKYVEVIDHIRNPFGIYKEIRRYANQNGSFYLKDQQVDITKPDAHWDSYKPKNEDEYVVVATDHLSLLSPEKDSPSLHGTMSKYSSDYCIIMRNKFKYTVVNVQQQEAAKEKQEFYKGQTIENKLEPSLDGLGDNKLTGRDADEVYGLFAPERYSIPVWKDYDITRLQDTYRQLSKLKGRNSGANSRIGLYFNGISGEYKELPKPADMTDEIYELVRNYKY